MSNANGTPLTAIRPTSVCYLALSFTKCSECVFTGFQVIMVV